MPNSKQAKKRVRQSEVRRDRNKALRTSMRTAMKKVLDADSDESAQAALPAAMKAVDKATKRSVIHANAAARHKGRLSRRAAGSGS